MNALRQAVAPLFLFLIAYAAMNALDGHTFAIVSFSIAYAAMNCAISTEIAVPPNICTIFTSPTIDAHYRI